MKRLIALQLWCLLISICAVPHASVSLKIDESMRGLDVHGNWCGPGHGGSKHSDLPCIDDLDCNCRVHDICYGDHGSFNCQCDEDLVDALTGRTDPKSVGIRLFFSVNPCMKPTIVPKTCRKCTTVFGRSLCTPLYPCSLQCKMFITLSRSKISGYKC